MKELQNCWEYRFQHWQIMSLATQANIHQDAEFSKSFMRKGVWKNEATGTDSVSVTSGQFIKFSNLFKDFVVEPNTQVVTASGRVANAPKGDGSKIIRGCLAESTKEQKESHSTRDRVCTHTIVQAGSPEAKKSDKLILGNRAFYIIDLDEVGSLGISTIYYAEERKDVK